MDRKNAKMEHKSFSRVLLTCKFGSSLISRVVTTRYPVSRAEDTVLQRDYNFYFMLLS